MNWFDTAGFANLAKSAFNSAQKTIDRALDIREDKGTKEPSVRSFEDDSFFASYGLGQKNSPKTTINKSASDEVIASGSAKDKSWNDWGSFFDSRTKGQEISYQDEHDKEMTSDKNKATVFSQPQQSCIFPSGEEIQIQNQVIQEKNLLREDSEYDSCKESDFKIETHLTVTEMLTELTPSLLQKTSDIGERSIQSPSELLALSQSIIAESNNIVNIKTESTNTELPVLEKNDCPTIIERNLSSSVLGDVSSSKERNIEEQSSSDFSVMKHSNTTSTCVLDDVSSLKESNVEEQLKSDFCIMKHSNTSTCVLDYASSSKKNNVDDSDSDFCVMKRTNSENLESNNSLLILSASTDDESNINYSPHQQINISGYNIWEWNSIENEGNVPNYEIQENLAENKSTAEFEDEPLSSDSVVPVSDDVLSVDSPEHTADTYTSAQPSEWLVTSYCDQENKTCEDQIDNETKDEESETPELREYDVKSSDSIGSLGTNSSSSFVKCSIGEADSYYSPRGNSESCTTSEHSDNHKYQIEHLCDHTSGEENETTTTTSSDIEIISSPNGENGDLHPSMHLKQSWLSRTYGRRSESPNSDSSIMPVVQEVEEDMCNQRLRAELYDNREGPIDCENDLEASRKTLIQDSTDVEELLKRQTELEEVLENREKRVLQLSKEVAELHESNSLLESEIKRLEEIRNKDSRHTSELTQEFTQRIVQLENKLTEACKERDSAEEKLEALEKEAVSRLSASEVEAVIKEKDQLITELMEEGEKLSKQQLQHTSLIKKLRSKDKERENLLKTQKESLDEQGKELERLRKSLGAKDEQEKRHIETIRQLTITVQQKEKDLSFLKAELDDATETVNSLKKSLDNSYKEIIEIQKSNAEKESQAQEVALSSEMAAKEELQKALEHIREEATRERDTLLAQLEELRYSSIKAEQQAHCREETLQLEIAQIQKRLQESEKNSEELTSQISSATLPLLRQIDNLQSTFALQSSSWEKNEENLCERINEYQSHVDLLEQKEIVSRRKCQELSSKVSDLEIQVNGLQKEKTQLTSQLELRQMKLSMLEESKNRECVSIAAVKQNLAEEISKLKQDKDKLMSQVETYRSEVESERQKTQKFQEQLVEKDKHKSDHGSNGTSSPTVSRLSSVSDRLNWWVQDASNEPPASMTSSAYSHSAFYDTLRLGSASSILESLQSQLKQRDGEISLLQSEIAQLERIRGSMTQEFAEVSCQYEAQKNELDELKNVQTAYSDMEQKYNTLLQMYGEKVEEAEELQLDLQDVKAMYRTQLEELLKKS